MDIAVAAAIDGGLITPVVRQADNKGMETIFPCEMKEPSARARRQARNLRIPRREPSASPISGCTDHDFCAVINPPQACIRSGRRGEQRPVVKDGGACGRDGDVLYTIGRSPCRRRRDRCRISGCLQDADRRPTQYAAQGGPVAEQKFDLIVVGGGPGGCVSPPSGQLNSA